MTVRSSGRRVFILFCALFLLFFQTEPVLAASYPADLHPPYAQGDSSAAIKQIKFRLQELGYFSEGASLTTSFSEHLAERVQQFRERNGLPASKKIDSAFLTALYSENAVPASGKGAADSASVSVTSAASNPTASRASSADSDASAGRASSAGASASDESERTASSRNTSVSRQSASSHQNTGTTRDEMMYFFIGLAAVLVLSLIYVLIHRKIPKKPGKKR